MPGRAGLWSQPDYTCHPSGTGGEGELHHSCLSWNQWQNTPVEWFLMPAPMGFFPQDKPSGTVKLLNSFAHLFSSFSSWVIAATAWKKSINTETVETPYYFGITACTAVIQNNPTLYCFLMYYKKGFLILLSLNIVSEGIWQKMLTVHSGACPDPSALSKCCSINQKKFLWKVERFFNCPQTQQDIYTVLPKARVLPPGYKHL